MLGFRIVLIALLATIIVYTGTVGARHGWDLMPVFNAQVAAMDWPGQFNVDFTSFLTLSALWTAWRNRWSVPGLLLAVVAFFGGGLFLTTYLLILSRNAETVAEVITGRARA